MLKCNLSGLLRQASAIIRPSDDRSGISFMLKEVADHIDDVRSGEFTLDAFAEAYCLKPTVSGMNEYPEWICAECGDAHGARGRESTWHMGHCDWCGRSDIPITEPRDYGYPAAPQKPRKAANER